MCAAGVLAAASLIASYLWACGTVHCGAGSHVCRIIQQSPPWALLAGIATLPAIALGWYWRTDIHNEELVAAAEKGRAERFVKYAEMLGHNDASPMLGGIHGLKHLAVEDETRRGLVVDMLASFIRRHARRDSNAEELADMRALQGSDEHEEPPTLVVATAVEALSKLDATGVDLRDVDLTLMAADRVSLAMSDFRGARLYWAEFKAAKLGGGKFDAATCSKANFTNADLKGATFERCNLWGANFFGADLADADLRFAILTNADLRGANLRGANLQNANFDGALIAGALMTRKQFESAEGTPQDQVVWRPIGADE
jgi:uncharacterized protein YjbI with pentapeptide repeats